MENKDQTSTGQSCFCYYHSCTASRKQFGSQFGLTTSLCYGDKVGNYHNKDMKDQEACGESREDCTTTRAAAAALPHFAHRLRCFSALPWLSPGPETPKWFKCGWNAAKKWTKSSFPRAVGHPPDKISFQRATLLGLALVPPNHLTDWLGLKGTLKII